MKGSAVTDSIQGSYQVELPVFSGPLDLLIHLIERNELDITAISLAAITEQYLQQVDQFEVGRYEQLIDFIVIGAKLVLIKSRALLPRPIQVFEEDLEDPAEALARQLRTYKKFREAANWLARREEEGLRTYLRVATPPKLEATLDMSGVSLTVLALALRAAIQRTQPKGALRLGVMGSALTIDSQINLLRHTVKTRHSTNFVDLLPPHATWVDFSVTLQAILELIKRQEIIARQEYLFGPVEILPFPKESAQGVIN